MIKKFIYHLLLTLTFVAMSGYANAQLSTASVSDPNFINFIEKFRRVAIDNKISIATYNKAFDGVTAPYVDMLRYIRTQPEFHQTPEQYLKPRITEARIAQGQIEKQRLSKTLKLIENKFGVDKTILLAIWANETDYGAVLNNKKIMKDAVRALATLAYYKSHYNHYAKTQLIALLKILQHGDIPRSNLQASWAGAMGHTQFIPTSYLLYAIDMNKDGKSDIVNSVPDALATTANLLAKHGWKAHTPWIYEVTAKNIGQLSALKNQKRTLDDWAKTGITLINNQQLPKSRELATLEIIGTVPTRCFLELHNFKVIKAYNNSNLYALAVALLANKLNK